MRRVISRLATCLMRKSDMSGEKNKKKKKEKIVYIDDGSTIADMSSLGGRSKDKKQSASRNQRYRAPLKDQFQTFRDAQRAMFLPMLAVLGIIALAFLIVYILL